VTNTNKTVTEREASPSPAESRTRTRTRVRRGQTGPAEGPTTPAPSAELEVPAPESSPASAAKTVNASVSTKAAPKKASVKKKAPVKAPADGDGSLELPSNVTETLADTASESELRVVRTRTRRPFVSDPFTVTITQPPAANDSDVTSPEAPSSPDAKNAATEGATTEIVLEPDGAASVVRRRRRRATSDHDAPVEAAPAPAAADAAVADVPVAEPISEPTLDEEATRAARTRRRTRGRRSPGVGESGGKEPDASTASRPRSAAAAAGPRKPDTKRAAAAVDAPVESDAVPDSVDKDDAPAPTRLQARSRRGGRPGRNVRGRGGRRVLGGVSEETRRAITEGPPRRMLVSVGSERTQIAVLEERVLVEHYVTHRKETSYVGNIYQGRVQNVLPGMEAAFIDVGKGRNGVLYAGEVNYDESDLDGELPRIEQTLKPGQVVLVQVTKDPMGTKGARLTQHLSIAGRYCVLAPGDGMLGISRKLTDEERERLRKILKSIKPEEYGLIVRTAAEGATAEQLEADVARLVRIWEQVAQRAGKTKPLAAVYEEPDLVIRVIRDVFGPEYTELVVDSPELGQQVRDYLEDVSPELVDRVSVYEGEQNILDAYEVTNQVRRALEKKVWLKSGGYLIVEKTEAMWIIDVNTGKFVGERNLEETVLRNNIEAAVEIARQLRLRDMGGIIVIDFVDMLLPANREEVLKRFRRELARDKTKSRVMEISKLGLVQMTRKNVSQGLQESFMTRCDECEGRGHRMIADILV